MRRGRFRRKSLSAGLRSFSCNDESVWTPGENVARSIEFSSTCWLIKRGSQWLLWDTGVPESALNDPKGWSTLPKLIVYHLDKALTDQLAEIGLNTSDITYVALRSLGLEPLFSPFAVSIVIDELLDRVRATRRQIRVHTGRTAATCDAMSSPLSNQTGEHTVTTCRDTQSPIPSGQIPTNLHDRRV
jgi:hypothetical protein